MKRLRAGHVCLSDHAFERWKQRVDPQAKRKKVALKIRRRIAAELKNGASVNQNGALDVVIKTVGDAGSKVWAHCYPSLLGGWEVATIIKNGRNKYEK